MYLKQTMHCRYSTTVCDGWQAFERAREAPILDVIQDLGGIELRRQGRNYVGLCPFHQEKTPSFTVTPDKQMFYCFGCGVGGDGIAFIAKLRGLRPLEAARMIARHFGLSDPNAGQELRPIWPKLPEREAAARRRMAALNAAWREAWIIATAYYRAAVKANEAAGYSDPFFAAAEIEAEDILNRLEACDPQVRLTTIREVLN